MRDIFAETSIKEEPIMTIAASDGYLKITLNGQSASYIGIGHVAQQVSRTLLYHPHILTNSSFRTSFEDAMKKLEEEKPVIAASIAAGVAHAANSQGCRNLKHVALGHVERLTEKALAQNPEVHVMALLDYICVLSSSQSQIHQRALRLGDELHQRDADRVRLALQHGMVI